MRESATSECGVTPQFVSEVKDERVAFYSTLNRVRPWFLTKNKNAATKRSFRDPVEMEVELALAA
jgi:hypothetical protein